MLGEVAGGVEAHEEHRAGPFLGRQLRLAAVVEAPFGGRPVGAEQGFAALAGGFAQQHQQVLALHVEPGVVGVAGLLDAVAHKHWLHSGFLRER